MCECFFCSQKMSFTNFFQRHAISCWLKLVLQAALDQDICLEQSPERSPRCLLVVWKHRSLSPCVQSRWELCCPQRCQNFQVDRVLCWSWAFFFTWDNYSLQVSRSSSNYTRPSGALKFICFGTLQRKNKQQCNISWPPVCIDMKMENKFSWTHCCFCSGDNFESVKPGCVLYMLPFLTFFFLVGGD